MQASQFVQVIEEAAYKMGYINKKQFIKLVKPLTKSGYGKNLLSALSE